MSDQKNTPAKTKKTKPKDEFFIVGIGGGAGSHEALQVFFQAHLSSTNATFILVNSASYSRTLKPELLSQFPHLQVELVQNGTPLQADHVYLIQNNREFVVENNTFHLVKSNKENPNPSPIDSIFRSLAENYKSRAVGIILSGAGNDGITSLKGIKENGGLVLVQIPESARISEMPDLAIATGLADHILTPRDLAQELAQFFYHAQLLHKQEENPSDQTENKLAAILELIRSQTPFDFTGYKKPTLLRRTIRRMALNKVPDISAYASFLQTNHQETHTLSRDFLIGVTQFFRDPEVFDAIKKLVVPELVRNNHKRKLVKAWSIGCSTGEEAYTLAIIFREFLDIHGKDMEVKIFATDIDDVAIAAASKGIFSNEIEKELSPYLLKKYFTRDGEYYRVKNEIRKMVIFSVHNVFKDPPFYQIDLITCRNMLIYMQPELQRKAYSRMHFSLNLHGYLVLGSNETLAESYKGFELLDKKWKIYRNTQISRGIGHDSLSVTETQPTSITQRAMGSLSVQKVLAESKLSDSLNEALMEHFGVACVYIDENYRILNAVGNFNRYLQLPDKKFSLNLLKMVSQDLSVALGTAVRKALKEQTKILYGGMTFVEDGLVKNLALEVIPLQVKEVNTQICCMVLFIEEKATRPAEKIKVEGASKVVNQRILDLEQELAFTQENLQSTIEELETSNEELQSSNEELLAANEELQSTNEELQSVNEELHTVNTEYQEKINELAQVTDDIDNLLKNTNIGTLFLDLNLKIRKFTPAVLEQFSLISADIGRPITNISSNLENINELLHETRRVIETFHPFEAEVQTNTGQWFLMRIQPYVTKDKVIKGAVLTFVNITEIKSWTRKLEEKALELQASEDKWQSLVQNSMQTILLVNAQNQIMYLNDLPEALRQQGLKPTDFIGTNYFDVVPRHELDKVKDIMHRVYVTGQAQITELGLSGTDLIMEASFIPHRQADQTNGIIIIKTDITARKRLENDLALSREQLIKQNLDLEEFAYYASHDLKTPVANLQSLLEMANANLTDERQRNLFQKITDSAEAIQNTISTMNQVITTKNSLVLEKEKVRFDNVLRQTLRGIEQMVKNSGAQFEFDFSEKPELFYPPVHLQSIMQNLLTNAIKYTKKGQAPQIEVKSGVKNGYVYLQVKDDGLGLNLKRDGKQLFGLFKRFHNHVEGDGIGLHLVKAIAETYGGSIEVESQPDNGATFTVYLYPENEESRKSTDRRR